MINGDAISLRVSITRGQNRGKIINNALTPMMAKFFGYEFSQQGVQQFESESKRHINELMPPWIAKLHD
jgi:hypothetical protein